MVTTTKARGPYIPDSTKAEKWLTDDIFVWHRKHYRVLDNFQVVRIPKNNKGEVRDGE